MHRFMGVSSSQVFTYEDSNMLLAQRLVERGAGFTSHRRVAVRRSDWAGSDVGSGGSSGGRSEEGSPASDFLLPDFLAALHRNASAIAPRLARARIPAC
jgi:hypothetical protein